MYRTSFDVEGDGYFPLDMLRYDTCFPASQTAVERMSSRLAVGVKRRVELVQYHATKQSNLTPDRWKSFRWEILCSQTTKV